MRLIRIILILMLLSSSIYSEKLIEFRMDFLPNISVEKNYIYAQGYETESGEEEVILHIYSNIRKGNLIKSIILGQRSNKSGDYSFPHIQLFKDYIVFKTSTSLIYYNKKGDIVIEQEKPKGLSNIVLIGSGIAGIRYSKTRSVYEICIRTEYDDDFQTLEIHNSKSTEEIKEERRAKFMYRAPQQFLKSDGKYLVFGDTAKGCHFLIYDQNGNLFNEINYEYKKASSQVDKQKLKERVLKGLPDELKGKVEDLKIEKFYPPYRTFQLNNKRIYINTYKKVDGKREVIILDYYGRLKGKYYLQSDGYSHYFFDDKCYYIKMNRQTHNCELHVEEIE